MARKRRRGIHSDWVIALKESRTTKRLRSLSRAVTNSNPARMGSHSMADANPIDRDPLSHSIPCANNTPNSEPINEHDTADIDVDHDTVSHAFLGSCERKMKFPSQELEQDQDDNEVRSELHDGMEPQYPIWRIASHDSGVFFQPFDEDFSHREPDTPCGSDEDVISDSESYRSSDSASDQSSVVTEDSCAGEEHHSSRDVVTRHESAIVNGDDSNSSDVLSEADLDVLHRNRRRWEGVFTLTAMISVVGSLRYSVQDYEFCRDIVTEAFPGSGIEWPTYSKVHKLFKEVIKSCLPTSHLVELPLKWSHDLGQFGELRSQSGRADQKKTEPVRIFLPSAWAKLDVATSVVFRQMYPEEEASRGFANDFERRSSEHGRRKFIDACDHIMIPFRGENVACGPESLITICLRGSSVPFSTPYNLSTDGIDLSLSGLTVATWCVGSRNKLNPSFMRAAKNPSLSPRQKKILTALSIADNREKATNAQELLSEVLPGDICTLLSAESTAHTHVECFEAVLVNRFWRFEDGTPSSFVLWVRPCDTSVNDFSSIEVAESYLVRDISLRRPARDPSNPEDGKLPSQGTLSSGMPFVVYRVLLYCDDFQKSSGPYSKGSAGGCYLLPMSLPPEARRSTSAVRIISLTPPGVSTNDVLHYITDDLVTATVYGIDGTTPKGDKVKIFVDVMGFIGDYPAAAGAVDVVGHTGRAPCNLCSFRRLHADEASGSRYGYTTTVHAQNSTFLRHAERHISLRRSVLSDEDAITLGMISSNRATDHRCPLIYLSTQLQEFMSNAPLTSTGRPVLSRTFDPYRSNVVAPDHLLTGLSKNILNTSFEALPSDEMRTKFDILICASLQDNGLLKQKNVFNITKKVLHSMTLSELYCVMLVTEPIMNLSTSSLSPDHISRHAYLLLSELQALIALTYWWPQRCIDGEAAVSYVEPWGGEIPFRSESKSQILRSTCRCVLHKVSIAQGTFG